MNKEEVYSNLNEVFKDVFDDETITVNENTTADDIEMWDSFEHINLISAVEKKFAIKFNMKEIVELHNVGEMADLILSKLA